MVILLVCLTFACLCLLPLMGFQFTSTSASASTIQIPIHQNRNRFRVPNGYAVGVDFTSTSQSKSKLKMKLEFDLVGQRRRRQQQQQQQRFCLQAVNNQIINAATPYPLSSTFELHHLIKKVLGMFTDAASKMVPLQSLERITTLNLVPFRGIAIWSMLFLVSAALQAADSAFTKISSWKVQEFAEEEGANSPFAILSTNMNRLLSTIVISSTICSIYSTALFVSVITQVFPQSSLGSVTVFLTLITLFLGELLPKALAVSNSEMVARTMIPLIHRLSLLLLPITSVVTFLSESLLHLLGMKSKEENNVTEDMLRLVVNDAEKSDGIHTDESKMIRAVLDMEETEINRVMQPRVDIIALPENASANQLLDTVLSTRYSRIPIYKGDIDKITGIVFSKDLLAQLYSVHPTLKTVPHLSLDDVQNLTLKWQDMKACDLMQPAYFIPETMKTWKALQEMKQRRVHMAIVVDEYGGTAGLVTFEDILEEVVGEIYDEDDFDEQKDDSKTIYQNGDGSFTVAGNAELDHVCDALAIDVENSVKDESSTIGGFLCFIAGQIPKAGDKIRFGPYDFVILEVEDNRRIQKLKAVKDLIPRQKTHEVCNSSI